MGVAVAIDESTEAVEPWAATQLVPILLDGFDDNKEDVRSAARACAKAISHALSGRAVRQCMMALYPALSSTSKPKLKIEPKLKAKAQAFLNALS